MNKKVIYIYNTLIKLLIIKTTTISKYILFAIKKAKYYFCKQQRIEKESGCKTC